MKQYSFATVITSNDGVPLATHLPIVVLEGEEVMYDRKYYSKILENLDPKLSDNRYTVEARKRLAAVKDLKKGDLLPEISGEDVNADPVNLVYGSNFTLVEFWASWCAPCRAVNPSWVKLYKTYRPKGLEIIGVSFDTSRPSWKKAIDQDQLPWQHISELMPMDESENSIKFNVTTVPANYLLDKHKKIIAVNVTPEALEKYLLTI